MNNRVYPAWAGYFLMNPLRKLFENPEKMLGPHVRPGMTVLEPGPGMGYFTLPLARMVGPGGRVVAVDLQPKMVEVLARRARSAGLEGVVEARVAESHRLGVADLTGRVDFAAAIHLVHEVPDQPAFLEEVRQTLKPGGRLLVIEPRFHVKIKEFEKTLGLTQEAGYRIDQGGTNVIGRTALLSL